MVDISTEVKISCPRDKVSDYATNPDNAPMWYVNIKSVEWKTPKPFAIGSQIAFKAQFLGRQLGYIYKVIEFIPGQKLVMRTFDGQFPMETTYTWEIIDEKTTLMNLSNKGNPTGFSKLFAPFISLMIKKANQNDLKLLKSILEKQLL